MRVHGGRGTLQVSGGISPEGRILPSVEYPTLTCAHCMSVVVLNTLRQRQRGFCRRCYAYVCDSVGCNAECHPIMADLDLAQKYPELGEPFLLRGKNGEYLADIRLRDNERIF